MNEALIIVTTGFFIVAIFYTVRLVSSNDRHQSKDKKSRV